MQIFQNFLARCVFSALMLLAAGAAAAGPLYRVDIDTTSLGSGTAWLGLSFLALDGADGAGATVGNFAGALAGAGAGTGSVGGALPGALVFASTAGGGDFVQAIALGGRFSFDVGFVIGTGDTGAAFSWALFDETSYLGLDGDLGSIFLAPGAAPALQVTVTPANPFSSVSAVPEPATAFLLLAGLCLVAAQRARMRQV